MEAMDSDDDWASTEELDDLLRYSFRSDIEEMDPVDLAHQAARVFWIRLEMTDDAQRIPSLWKGLTKAFESQWVEACELLLGEDKSTMVALTNRLDPRTLVSFLCVTALHQAEGHADWSQVAWMLRLAKVQLDAREP